MMLLGTLIFVGGVLVGLLGPVAVKKLKELVEKA